MFYSVNFHKYFYKKPAYQCRAIQQNGTKSTDSVETSGKYLQTAPRLVTKAQKEL